MSAIFVISLLEKYKIWVTNDEIQFLTDNPDEKSESLRLIDQLIFDINTAKNKGELSSNLDWHETHEHGKDLWRLLASCALNHIDPDSKGNSKLFQYVDAATNFEDLLYGLEPYYRDHTIHSIWVYFIGEFILRELIPDIANNLNWHLFNDIEVDKTSYSPSLLKKAKEIENKVYKTVNKNKDAIWCLMALCHDLGYSLSKLEKLNKRALDVLGFFDIPNLRHIGYSMDIEHQPLLTQLLELMSFDIRIVPSSTEKEVLVKCYRDDSTFWRLCRAIEKKQHGIYSSYLLYKILGIFADTAVRGTADEWGLEQDEIVDNIVRGEILFSIAQHEFDFAHLYQLSSLADLLVIADELEEFSRFGRQMLSKKYFDTMAEAKISFSKNKPKQGDEIEVYMDYEVLENRKLANFYKWKAIRLCKIYSLGQPRENTRYCTIEKIRMTASKEKRRLEFHLCRSSNDNKGFLPATIINGEKLAEGFYNLKILDDNIMVIAKPKLISLEDWFNGIQDQWWAQNKID